MKDILEVREKQSSHTLTILKDGLMILQVGLDGEEKALICWNFMIVYSKCLIILFLMEKGF
jgi:hypothetical protein